MARLLRVATTSIRRRLAAVVAPPPGTSTKFGTATFCRDDGATGTGRFA